MKRLITLLLLVAFTTAILPVNAFGPIPGQLEYQNNGYFSPYNQYGSFSPTPQQNQYNGYDSYNQNDGSYGSFSPTPQQGQSWEYVCSHNSSVTQRNINIWHEEYNDNKHIEYREYEILCNACCEMVDTIVKEEKKYHNFTRENECFHCGYTAKCNHQWTSRQTANYWYEVYDGYYHSEVYIEEEVCNNCGDVLGSQQKSKIWSHQYQNGRCWECGYIQQTTSQPQYTPPVVNAPEYVEPEPEEEYVEEPVYVEQPQQSTTVLPYQQALEEGRAYAVTPDGLHINKRNYALDTALGYADKYYCSINSIYAPLYLPADEVYEEKGDYLYRVSTGERVSASPSILKICDARISELKSTLKGLSDASSRVEQYKQVKKGQIPLTSIVEQNRSYIAKSGVSNSKLIEVQKKLLELGYTSQEKAEDYLDSYTMNNLAYFQSQHGIYITGWLENETYNAIMSYGNTPVVNKSPFANITQLYQDGRKLIISAQGNQYTTTLIIMVKGLGGETFFNTNTATKTFSLKDNGVYEVELYAKNASGEMYTAPIQTINVQLPTIIQEVFESAANERIMQTEMQAGLLTSLVSNLVLQPAANLANVVDRVIDIDRYGYYDKQQARQEIVDNFRNGAVQYLGNPGYFYVGQVCGDVLSVGAEIYLTASGVKGIVDSVQTIKGGAKLVQLQTIGTYQPVVLLVDGAGIATSTTSVLQVGIASNAMLGNIQNAVTGNSSSSNNGVNKIKTNLGNEIDIAPSNNHSSVRDNPGYNSTPNSSVDIMDSDGSLVTRRWYDSNGKAVRDVDFTNHGNAKSHPEWPHEHYWSYDGNGNPTRY